jgi:hypothetical protein
LEVDSRSLMTILKGKEAEALNYLKIPFYCGKGKKIAYLATVSSIVVVHSPTYREIKGLNPIVKSRV